MFWHIDEDIICLFFIVALYIVIRKDYRESSRRDVHFLLCVFCCGLVMLIDIAASVIMEVPSPPVWLYHLLMTVYFASVLLSIVTWAMYTAAIVYEKNEKLLRRAYVAVCVPYVIYLGIIIANLGTGWIYSLNPATGEYSRGTLFALLYVVYACYAVGLIVFICVKWRHVQPKHLHWLLLALPILLALGIYVQISVPGWLTIMPSQAIALFIAFLFIQNDRTISLMNKKQEELQRVSEAANLDLMTGLCNHRATLDRVQACLNTEPRLHALFIIDLDDFKAINDTLGHQTGDLVISETAARVRACFRDGDIVGRIGGDEFLVLMRNIDQPRSLPRKATDLLQALQFTCGSGAKRIELTGSIGAGLWRGDESFEHLYARTDKALYDAKASGKNRYVISEPEKSGHEGEARIDAVHLQTLLEHMDGGIVLATVGAKLDINYVSPSYYRSLVIDRELCEGEPSAVLKQIYDGDLDTVYKTCRNAAESGKVTECSYRIGDMGERWHMLRVAPIPSENVNQERASVICVITDITELKATGHILSAMIKDTSMGISAYEVIDSHTIRRVYSNDMARELNALRNADDEERVRANALLAVHPEDRAFIESKLGELKTHAMFESSYRSNPELCLRNRRIFANCAVIGVKSGNPLMLVISAAVENHTGTGADR